MNEFGEPNMGNPSVRFDEGRGRVVIGYASSLQLPRLLYITEANDGRCRNFEQKVAKVAKAKRSA